MHYALMRVVRDSCKIRPYFCGNRIFDRFVKFDNILLISTLCKTSSEPNLFHLHIHCHAYPLNVKGKCLSCIETCQFHIGRVSNLSKEREKDTYPKCLMEKPKKTILQSIMHEIHHYYNGSRLLAINTKISWKLAMKLLKGQTLTRRENNLLVRTMTDIFRLVPFSIFLLIPLLELALPIVLKFFPGLLPSTFQTAAQKEMKMKNTMKIKMETAKFLLKTLQCMPVAFKGCTLENSKKFQEFALKIYASGGAATREEIIKFSTMFQDDITLNCLSRHQLIALCKVLEIPSLGTSNILRFRIKMRLKRLLADDKAIQAEGVETMTLEELQQACKARGIRAYGRSKFQMRTKLMKWLDLSLNANVPTTLLLLSQALLYPGYDATADKLKSTISSLPDSLLTQTNAAICENDAKIDNELKIQALKGELSIIKKEKEEMSNVKNTSDTMKISSKDIEILESILAKLAITKEKYLLEKEKLKCLRTELQMYQKDGEKSIEEINLETKEGCTIVLCRKIDRILKEVSKDISACEENEKLGKQNLERCESVLKSKCSDSRVNVEELISTLKQIQNQLDSNFVKKILDLLKYIDHKNERFINICDVLMIIKIMANENVDLNKKQVTEILDLLHKKA